MYKACYEPCEKDCCTKPQAFKKLPDTFKFSFMNIMIPKDNADIMVYAQDCLGRKSNKVSLSLDTDKMCGDIPKVISHKIRSKDGKRFAAVRFHAIINQKDSCATNFPGKYKITKK